MTTKKTKKTEEITLPAHIDIAGERFTIEYVDKVVYNDIEGFLFGISIYPNRSIKIATKDMDGNTLTAGQIETTLWHEVAHMILSSGQYNKLNQNEALVEWIGRCLKDICLSIQGNPSLHF